MRQLRSCDFCADDAVGTFEVIPPEFEPTDDEQRRVALCADCRGQLQTLLEPLVARLRAESANGRRGRREDSRTGPPTERIADRGAERGGREANRRRSRTDPTATADSTAARGDSRTADDEGVTVAETATANADASERKPRTDEESAAVHETEPEPDGESAASRGTETGTNEGKGSNRGTEEGTNEGNADSSRDPARAYRKVVQLLYSREFPMKRREAESFVADAYGVDRDAVATLIDHAVENGEFEQKWGKLRKP
ncbi:hypothetical protein [Natronobacterium texcoconense]|uniref:Uncharacterized protein n=1 Tax=Natronobacterium texcoconense TaxID=1095778 RepID=A0A1H1J0P7_NATTX|nr:hypothetical protein [Natronobacterium texcoconense]SDR43541.1 hypothetical protein SAMN04489842_3973 [Natronobacterium texcoconense]